MKKRNLIAFYSIYCLVSVLLFSVSSCSDDIIKSIEPEDQLDSVHLFNFKTDTLQSGLIAQFYANDTNNVFYPASNNYFLHYTNLNYKVISFTDPEFSPTTSAGLNENNVFFGGTNNSGGCMICKIQGDEISNYTVPGDTSLWVENILVLGENELWMGTLKNIVYYFNSGVFTKYLLDSAFQTGQFFKVNGEIFVLATQYINGENVMNQTYKFTGEEFLAIARDSGNLIRTFINRCGDDAIRISESTLYYFDGKDWQFLYNTTFGTMFLSGPSKENMLCYGVDFLTHTWGYYIRKDNRWYRESTQAPMDKGNSLIFSPLYYSQGRYYIQYAPAQAPYMTILQQLLPIN